MTQLHKGKDFPRATPIDLHSSLTSGGQQPGIFFFTNLSAFSPGIIDTHLGTARYQGGYSFWSGKGKIRYICDLPPFSGINVRMEFETTLRVDGSPDEAEMWGWLADTFLFLNRRWTLPQGSSAFSFWFAKSTAYYDYTNAPSTWAQNDRLELDTGFWNIL